MLNLPPSALPPSLRELLTPPPANEPERHGSGASGRRRRRFRLPVARMQRASLDNASPRPGEGGPAVETSD